MRFRSIPFPLKMQAPRVRTRAGDLARCAELRDYFGTLGASLFHLVPVCSAKGGVDPRGKACKWPVSRKGALSSVGRASRLHGDVGQGCEAQES